MNIIFIVTFAFTSYVYCDAYEMLTLKSYKPFVASPQVMQGAHGFMGIEIAGFGLNGYGSNQYKSVVEYMPKPISWPGFNYGMSTGFGANSNGFQTDLGSSPVVSRYRVASLNGNNFGTVKEYTPVYAGHGGPSSSGYSANNFDVNNNFKINGFNSPAVQPYKSPRPVPGFKYTNAVFSAQDFRKGNNPAMVSGYGKGVMINTKYPQIYTSGKEQYMTVLPKEYVEYSSIPSFESSLRDIVKMVTEEQRKSNKKAIFVIGKPQFPMQRRMNQARHSTPISQMSFSKANPFSGYKY